MSEQYIFTIERLTKAYAKREVLKNIWLAFYPGAKIGVIGSNGAGKSSLLRIMAGVDTDFLGSARLTPGFTVGFVPQEPRLDESTDVRGNIEQAVALQRALLQKVDLLLLDEPTNHLDAESVAWLERHLQEYQGTVVSVTHDRYFLDNVAGWILELDLGYGIPWKGNYSSWLEQKQQRLAQEAKTETARQKT